MNPKQFQTWFTSLSPADRSAALTMMQEMFFKNVGYDDRARLVMKFTEGHDLEPSVVGADMYKTLKNLVLKYRSESMTYKEMAQKLGMSDKAAMAIMEDAANSEWLKLEEEQT